MYHSAVGSSSGFAFLGSNNLPFGADLKLGVLGNNGGPTKTHRPADTSPVINAGSNGLALQFDQRGVTRVIGGAADIGRVRGSDDADRDQRQQFRRGRCGRS